jgi:hypothetical protein
VGEDWTRNGAAFLSKPSERVATSWTSRKLCITYTHCSGNSTVSTRSVHLSSSLTPPDTTRSLQYPIRTNETLSHSIPSQIRRPCWLLLNRRSATQEVQWVWNLVLDANKKPVGRSSCIFESRSPIDAISRGHCGTWLNDAEFVCGSPIGGKYH